MTREQRLARYNSFLFLLISGGLYGAIKVMAADLFTTPMIIALLVAVNIMIFRVSWSLPLIILCLPFTAMAVVVGGLFFSPGDFLLGLGFVIWFLKYVLLGKEKAYALPMPFVVFPFVVFTALSTMSATDSSPSDMVQSVVFLILGPLLTVNIVRSKKELFWALHMMAINGLLVALYGFTESPTAGGRIYSIVGEPNAAAGLMAFSSAYCIALAFSQKHPVKKFIWTFITLVMAWSILTSQSRGGLLGMVGALIAMSSSKGFKVLIITTLLLIVSYYYLLDYLPGEVAERVKSIQDLDDKNTGYRPIQYRIAFEVMTREPFLGSGPGNLIYYTSEHLDPWITSPVGLVHNLFLHIGAERGVPCMILLAIYFFHSISLAYKATKKPNLHPIILLGYQASLGGILGYLVINQSAFFLLRGLGPMFGIAVGLLYATMQIERDDLAEAAKEAGKTADPPVLLGYAMPKPA